MIAWSISVPTFLGIAFGNWLDKVSPQTFTWTSACLIIGLFTGCMIVLDRIVKEHTEITHNETQNE
jgi:predicted F0F1-ATPase subunit